MFLIKVLNYDDLRLKFGGVAGGSTMQTPYDLAYNYFGSLGHTGTLTDMEYQFLSAAGFPVGTLADRWAAYMISLGYTSRLSDNLRSWARA